MAVTKSMGFKAPLQIDKFLRKLDLGRKIMIAFDNDGFYQRVVNNLPG